MLSTALPHTYPKTTSGARIERSLARSAQLDEEVREIQKHGDERLNALIALVDRMVRKTTTSVAQEFSHRPCHVLDIADPQHLESCCAGAGDACIRVLDHQGLAGA